MAGYEAMQRGAYGSNDASPTNNEPIFDPDNQGGPGQAQSDQQEDFWGGGQDPWGRGGPSDGPPPPSTGGEGEGGGGWMDSISDFFGDE